MYRTIPYPECLMVIACWLGWLVTYRAPAGKPHGPLVVVVSGFVSSSQIWPERGQNYQVMYMPTLI